VLARRVLPLAVPAGASVQRLAVGPLDLGSLFPLDSGVVFTGATYDAAVDEMNAIRRALGRRLTFWTGGRTAGVPDSVVVEVIGVDPERYRLPDGRITFHRPGSPLFPPDLVLIEPAALVGVRSDRARRSLGVGYFTSGAGWQARYTLALAGATATVSGHAVIQAGLLRVDTAQVQLVAGTVSRAPAAPMEGIAMRAARAVQEQAATEETLGEVHLYTLPSRVSFTPGLETSAALFDPTAAPVERSYTVRTQLPFWGPIPQYGEETTQPVVVTYTVQRRARTGFGDLPVPAGVARLYQRDQAGQPQLIGEAGVGATPAGQNLTLEAGVAFDLTAKRVQTAYTTRRDSLRTQAFASYTVTLTSARDSAVTVDVLEQRGGEWSVTSSSVPAEKLSSTTTRFRVRLPARGEARLTYRLRVVW
jgi:hypothetical protein